MSRPGSGRLTAGVIISLIIIVIVAVGAGLLFRHKAGTGAASNGKPGADSKPSAGSEPGAGSAVGSAPARPPARICADRSLLAGPAKAPAHAVRVPAGDNSLLFRNPAQANTIYYFMAGTHTLGPGRYSQIRPGENDVFIGAPGAILSGQMRNNYAFGPTARNVRIEHLTIQHFTPPSSEGAVTSNTGWTIAYNTVSHNIPGTGVYAGTDSIVKYNCLTRNGQQAFAAYTAVDTSRVTVGASRVVISHNEISRNNTCNFEAMSHFPVQPPSGCAGQGESSGCGCSGGGKFWATDNSTFNDNYVHDNYSVGMWADTNNTGLEIEGNYFSGNLSDGLIYEIGYNAVIRHNTFIRNAIGSGPYNAGFPDSAVYISQSGGDSRVPGRYSGKFQINGNLFIDNWSGVVLWENSNRYCTSSANTSTGDCTLVNPGVANLKTCSKAKLLARQPYLGDCRWRTMNVQVTGNVFRYTPGLVSTLCTKARFCGFNAIFAIYGTYPPYTAWKVPVAISDSQHNSFSNNTYYGPWRFLAFSQGGVIGWSGWTHGFTFEAGANKRVDKQDAGSVIHP